MSVEEIYSALIECATEHGVVGDYADELLGLAAEAIAVDPMNNEEND